MGDACQGRQDHSEEQRAQDIVHSACCVEAKPQEELASIAVLQITFLHQIAVLAGAVSISVVEVRRGFERGDLGLLSTTGQQQQGKRKSGKQVRGKKCLFHPGEFGVVGGRRWLVVVCVVI